MSNTPEDDLSISYRYDVLFNNKTGEILESVCRCKPGTCEFTDAYTEDGKPTHIPLDELDRHEFGGEVIEF